MTCSTTTEGLCSGLQKEGSVLDGVAMIELYGEWMLGQCDDGVSLISLQGRLEKRLEASGS
jgi:hypothetical protein